MRHFISGIFRRIIFPIISVPGMYYAGMVLIRLSRTARKLGYKKDNKKQFREVRFTGRLKMKVDINSYMGGSIYWAGIHHLNEIMLLQGLLKDGMTFVDVGANQGEFSIFAASRIPHGRVLAFEPVTESRSLLMVNRELNHLSQLEIYAYGLSDQAGSFPVYTTDDTSFHHGYNEGLSTLFKTDDRNVFEETVELKVFDDVFFTTLDRMDLVKIDVEGAELLVLKGMQKSLLKFRPGLLIEINEEAFNAAGYSTADLNTLLQKLNYQPYEIKKGKLRRIKYTDFEKWGNYFFQVTP